MVAPCLFPLSQVVLCEGNSRGGSGTGLGMGDGDPRMSWLLSSGSVAMEPKLSRSLADTGHGKMTRETGKRSCGGSSHACLRTLTTLALCNSRRVTVALNNKPGLGGGSYFL